MKKKSLLALGLSAVILLACSCPLLPVLSPTPPSNPTDTVTLPSTLPPSTQTLEPPPPISATDAPFNYSWEDREPFRAGLSLTGQSALTGLPGATIYHLALSLGNPPNRILGMEQIRYTNSEAVPLTELNFAIFAEILGGSIRVDNVFINNESVSPDFLPGIMRLPLSMPLEPMESVFISMEFEVELPSWGGDYYYGIFGYNQGILSFAHGYPTILVYDQDGWNSGSPDLDGDPLFADTSFYLVSVDAPVDLVLVASGVEVERTETAGRQRIIFADGPARDFYMAAGRGLDKIDLITGGVTVNSYFQPGSESSGRQALEVAARSIEIFTELYGAYPYSEFDVVPISTAAGGVEYPGLTSIALDSYAGDGSDWMETVVAHEVGHQWFYNLVGNDTQDQPWLDELLVEFITWEYYRIQYGDMGADSFEQEQTIWWQSADDPSLPIGLPVSDYSSNDYGAIVYGRGPLFFGALRDTMGQTAFDQLIRDYVQTFAWKTAYADDFKTLAELHCSCDLTPLFDEWVNP